MAVKINSVIENKEIVDIEKTYEYEEAECETLDELNAIYITVNDIKGVSDIERALYQYLENQGVRLMTSNEMFSTALINYPDYKSICLESYLLRENNSLERLFSLLHEIGHYLDNKFNHHGDSNEFNVWYGRNFENMELAAWAYGWRLLVALGGEHLKCQFMAEALKCLSTYTKSQKKALVGLQNMDTIVSHYENVCVKYYM